MSFLEVSICMIIGIIIGLLVAFIVLLISRAMMGKTFVLSQESKAGSLSWRKLIQKLKSVRKIRRPRVKPAQPVPPDIGIEPSQPPIPPEPDVEHARPPASSESDVESSSPISSERETEPVRSVSLEPEAGPANTALQEGEAATPSSLQGVEFPESFEEEKEVKQQKFGQGDDGLGLFRVEEMEDTGLSELAESLEDVDIHSLIKVTKETSQRLGMNS